MSHVRADAVPLAPSFGASSSPQAVVECIARRSEAQDAPGPGSDDLAAPLHRAREGGAA
jgi:hypothetical protein